MQAVRADDEAGFFEIVNTKETVVAKSNGKVQLRDGNLYYGDRQVTGLIASRIFEMLELQLSIDPMTAFIENLMKNPSKRAVDELFGFIDACDLPITEDGCFLAYRRINDDYTDCHSNSVFQKPYNLMKEAEKQLLPITNVGKEKDVTVSLSKDGMVEVSMPRNLVDEDKSRTCSSGLHFCSYNYLNSFSGERIIAVKINSADVVAIPIDYNNSKGRTCRYEVVEEMQIEGSMPAVRLDTKYVVEKQKQGEAQKPSNGVKMTKELADQLRDDWFDCELSQAEIQLKYGISCRQINRIINYEAWV